MRLNIDVDIIAGCLQVDRVSYLLQEIYGIENKNNQETKVKIISMCCSAA